MKILALGATGAIGGQLADILAEAGHKIHVTTRQARPVDGSITYIRGNARNDAFLADVLRARWDVIVDFMVYDTPTFRRRVDALLDATDQYLFISTGRVFADSKTPLTEGSPRLLDACEDKAYLATEEYALTKARQEDLLRDSGRTNWTIVRPYITFGEGRLQLGTLEKESWLYRACQGRGIVFCKPLMDRLTTMTDGADVAAMLAALVGNRQALGEDYNLTGAEAVTWGEVLGLYLDELERHLGRRPDVLLQDLETFCQAVKIVPQVTYDRMYDRRFDPHKIAAHYDMSQLADPLPALAGRLRSQLSSSGTFGTLDWRNEALRDKATHEHARLGEIRGTKPKLRYIGYRHIPMKAINRMGRL
ncbi:MAG: epimerase [Rhodobacteraceae bacterium]|nr:epimerase [Paracoccaceae bacterium]